MDNYKIKNISTKEKDRLIQSRQFNMYHDIWHYSFNEIFEKKYYYISDKQGRINIASKPLDCWSPLMIYANYNGTPLIRTINLVLDGYDKTDTGVNKVFWYVTLSQFDDFLNRRDQVSAHPRTNYPSTKTYLEKSTKINYKFYYEKFNREMFIKYYDTLKNPTHQSGEVVLAYLTSSMYRVPDEWLKMAYLTHDGEIVTVAVVVDDSKSICLFNMSAKRSNLGYGLIFGTELIKYGCGQHYYSIDGGVSGKYGIYKDKLFLDSKSVYEGEDIFYNPHRWSFGRKYIRNVYHTVKHVCSRLQLGVKA